MLHHRQPYRDPQIDYQVRMVRRIKARWLRMLHKANLLPAVIQEANERLHAVPDATRAGLPPLFFSKVCGFRLPLTDGCRDAGAAAGKRRFRRHGGSRGWPGRRSGRLAPLLHRERGNRTN